MIENKIKVSPFFLSKILAVESKNPNSDTSSLEQELDVLVYKLYELTEEEIGIVEGKNIN